MKNASKAMYTVGKVFSIIEIVLWVLLLIMSVLFIALAGAMSEIEGTGTAEEITAMGITLTITFGILLIVSIIVLILASRAKKALDNNTKENGPHIMMIIIGIFGDIFYTLGGIFGLIAENQNRAA